MAGSPTFVFGDQPALPAAQGVAPGVAQADRIRATARARFGAAPTATEQLAVAHDYLRAAAAAAARAGIGADPQVVEATRALVSAGDAVTDALAGRGDR